MGLTFRFNFDFDSFLRTYPSLSLINFVDIDLYRGEHVEVEGENGNGTYTHYKSLCRPLWFTILRDFSVGRGTGL